MINLSRAPQRQQWVAAGAPQIRTETPPKREIMGLRTHAPAMGAEWDACAVPACRPV